MINKLDQVLHLCKKYGLGLIFLVFFLFQYHEINNERREIQKTFEEVARQNLMTLHEINLKLNRMSSDIDKLKHK